MGKQHVGGFVVLGFLLTLASPALAGVERWTPFGPPQGTLVILEVDAAGNLYAATDHSGVYKSADRGESWSWSSVGMGAEQVKAIAVGPDGDTLYAAGRNRFFRSTDAGAHWIRIGQLPVDDDGELVHFLAIAPTDPDTLYLGRGRGVYRSLDGGATWARVLTTATAVHAVLVDPNNARSVFAGTAQPGALLHSTDGGATWTPVTEVEPAPDFPPGLDPFSYGFTDLDAVPTDPATLFAVVGLRLYRSTDAGATWKEIRQEDPAFPYTDSVAVIPGPQPRVYAFLQHVEGVSVETLVLSDDLGETWTTVAEQTRGFRLRVQPETGDLWSFGPSGIGISEDEGAEWRFSPLGAQVCGTNSFPTPSQKVRFASRRTYATAGGWLFVSRDAGKSWSALGRELWDHCVKIRDVAVDPRPGVLWMVDESVYRSNDGGETWEEVVEGSQIASDFPFLGITIGSPGTVLVNGCGVWRSGDDGRSWKETLTCSVIHDEFSEPDFIRNVLRLNVDPQRPQVVYAGAVESGERHPPVSLPYVYKSENGGQTWRRLVGNSYVLAIDPTRPTRVYLARPQAILRSLQRGGDWRRVSNFGLGEGAIVNTHHVDLEVDLFDPRILYAARLDGFWRSGDGGVTWRPFNAGLRDPVAGEVFPDPRRPGRLVVSTTDGLFEGRFAPPPVN
jgi:photosystem II stability/assembly factor-like uncharacterized protein